MSSLVDSNVVLDVVAADQEWAAWSTARLAEAADRGAVYINPVIYAESSIGFALASEFDRLIAASGIGREETPWAAAFLAGKAHVEYRRRGGGRARTLPDFLIGAHAQVRGHTLVTRDGRRYRDYFPGLDLIAPDGPSRSAP